MSKKLLVSIAASVVLAAGLVTTPSIANAASSGTGKINCMPSGKDVHTVSNSKGNVTHQIYGAKGYTSPIEHTSSITMGYSATYASWNSHHMWEFYSDGGKVFAGAIKSAKVQCE